MTEASDLEQQNAQHGINVAGCLGALLIHPIVLTLAFAHGFIYGSYPIAHGPPPGYGIKGGEMAIRYLLVLYLLSFGVLPLVLSGCGLWLGRQMNEVFRGQRPASQESESVSPAAQPSREE